jgi:hypothetical protein
MRRLASGAALLALLMAPIAARASEPAKPNPKLPDAMIAAPLVPKHPAPEARMGHGCMLGQAGGAAVSLMLGSGRAWDALADAVLGHPPNAEQRALCALGEALAPHAAAAAENVAQDLWSAARRQADAAKGMMESASAHMQQAWAGVQEIMGERSANAVSDFTRFCEGSASCARLRDGTANGWSQLWPMR